MARSMCDMLKDPNRYSLHLEDLVAHLNALNTPMSMIHPATGNNVLYT
jgi:hypothetical protein